MSLVLSLTPGEPLPGHAVLASSGDGSAGALGSTVVGGAHRSGSPEEGVSVTAQIICSGHTVGGGRVALVLSELIN